MSFPPVPGSAKLPRPAGTPVLGDVPEVSQVSPLELEWGTGGGGGLPAGVVVLSPSGDVTGATDVAAVQAAIAAFPDGLGVVLCAPGSWYGQPGNPIVLAQGQGLRGIAGSSATFWNAAGDGTGPMFSFANSGSFTGGQYAAPFDGLSMLGSAGSSGAVAIAASGLQGQRVSDLYIYGFAGGGVDLTNASDTYQEQGSWTDVVLVQNGSASGWNVLYSNSSFDYSVFEWTIVALADTDGIRLQDNAQLRGVRLNIRGNFAGGPDGNTGAVINMDPGDIAGTSYIQAADCYVAVESSGSGTGHTTLLQNSAEASAQFTGIGTFSFVDVGGVEFQGYSTESYAFSFAGTINEPVIGTTEAGVTGLIVYGQTVTNAITVQGNGNLASGNPAMFLQGDSQIWQFFLDNGTGNWGVYNQTGGATGLQLTPSLNLEVVAGNLDIQTAGKGLQVAEGSNAKQGTATLAAGTKVVSDTSVTASSRIFLTCQSLGTVTSPSALCVSARTAGTSFTILASQNTDTSVIAYEIFEPG